MASGYGQEYGVNVKYEVELGDDIKDMGEEETDEEYSPKVIELMNIENKIDIENLLIICYKGDNIRKLDSEMKIAAIEFIVDTIVMGRGNQEFYTAQTLHILAAIEESIRINTNYLTATMTILFRYQKLNLLREDIEEIYLKLMEKEDDYYANYCAQYIEKLLE